MARRARKVGSLPGDGPELLLAVDGGATHARAVIADVNGKVIGKGFAGPANSYAVGLSVANRNLSTAISQACKKSGVSRTQISVAAIGSASVDYDDSGAAPIATSLARYLPSARILVKPDALIALEGALGGKAGVVIVCGTGSIVLGRDANGSVVKVGGWGPMMGDEASAQWVGREGLRRAAQAADQTGPPTRLVQRFLRHYKLRSFDRIIDVVYQRHMTPAELGVLAPIVSATAREGDLVAREIFHDGAQALASQAAQAAERLRLRSIRISYQGSMFTTGPLLLNPLRTTLRRLVPQAKFVAPVSSPIAGAFLLALHATGVDHAELALEAFQRGSNV